MGGFGDESCAVLLEVDSLQLAELVDDEIAFCFREESFPLTVVVIIRVFNSLVCGLVQEIGSETRER